MGNEEEPQRDVSLREVMRQPVSVSPDAPAREALEVLRENGIQGIPVVDAEGNLEGYVTGIRLLDSAMPGYLKMMQSLSAVPESSDEWVGYLSDTAEGPVREVMSRDVPQVELGRSELAACHTMIHEGVYSVVVTEDGEVVGIVDLLDLYAAIVGSG